MLFMVQSNLVSKYEERFNQLESDPQAQMDFMLEAAPFIQKYSEATTNTQKHSIYQKFMELLDPTSATLQRKEFDTCKNCRSEMRAENGIMVCPACGLQGDMSFDCLTYQEEIEMNPTGLYTYKRINHFNEWIAQFQGQESTVIPEDVLSKIREDMRRTRFDIKKMNRDRMRAILKKLKLSKYYEHIPAIMWQVARIRPKKLTSDLEERMRLMFVEIQGPFEHHCPEERKNFLSYSYVLHKFCQLLDADEYIECFPLLKSKEKLKACDIIWKKICEDLSYEFIPTI